MTDDPKRRPLPPLSKEAREARRPLPVDELRDALQDRVHRDPGRARAARTVRGPRRGKEDALFDAVAPIAEALVDIRRRAEQLGMFVEERDLLACPGCGLMEDVAIGGVLFTYFGEQGDDTGLRFAEQPDGTFRCPSCGATVSTPEVDIENGPAPDCDELTPEQAAATLNVSTEYLARLLDEGCIPFRERAGHRLVDREALIAFKRDRDRDRATSLDDLARLSEDLGGYEEIPEDG